MDLRFSTRLAAAAVALAFAGTCLTPATALAQTPAAPKVKGKDKKDKEKKTQEPESVSGAGPKVGDVAPDWTAKDADGKDRKLSDLKGKIVVMDFWATWCGPCKMAMPGVQKIHEKYADKGVVVLGMNCMENAKGDPLGYMKSKNFTYTTMLKSDAAAKTYGVTGIPTFYVIGADGKVLFHEVGYDPSNDEKIAKVIDANLSKVSNKPDAAPKAETPAASPGDKKPDGKKGATPATPATPANPAKPKP